MNLIYAIVNIVASACFSCGYKLASQRGCRAPSVHLSMYLTAVVAALLMALLRGGFNFDFRVMLLGLTCGMSMFVAMRSFFVAMQQGGLAVGWTCVNMSVALPLFASMLFWHETPGSWQIVGLLLLIPCLLCFGNLHLQVSGNKRRWALLVGLSTFASGMIQLMIKIISTLSLSGKIGGEVAFSALVWNFGLGAAWLLFMGEGRHLRLRSPATGIGFAMGLCNVLAAWCFIKVLEILPGIVFFPVKAACGVVLTALLAVFLWKEKLTRRQVAGIVLGTLIAVLVTLS